MLPCRMHFLSYGRAAWMRRAILKPVKPGQSQLHRTIQVRVWPSTVQVTVVLPCPTPVTVPSPEMVATLVSSMAHTGLEEVP